SHTLSNVFIKLNASLKYPKSKDIFKASIILNMLIAGIDSSSKQSLHVDKLASLFKAHFSYLVITNIDLLVYLLSEIAYKIYALLKYFSFKFLLSISISTPSFSSTKSVISK